MATKPRNRPPQTQNGAPEGPPPVMLRPEEAELIRQLLSNGQVCSLLVGVPEKMIAAGLQSKLTQE